MPLIVRAATPEDRPLWEPLWRGYQQFYKVALADAVTETTWSRFFSTAEPVHCLVAEEGEALLGLAHYIFHRNTWMTAEVCYLQDLFTNAEARGKGIARALIEAVYRAARNAGSARVYWMTHESNAQAMALYDKVAEKSGFLQYRKPL